MSFTRELTRRQQIEAAVNDEQITRRRVDKLERGLRSVQSDLADVRTVALAHAGILTGRSVWDRLRWLVRGR